MRKFAMWCTVSLAVALLALPASALPVGPSAGVGVKGGLNLSKFSDIGAITQGEIGNDVKTGFIGGAYGKFALGPLNAQIEGLYSMRGAKGSLPAGLGDYEAKLNYFEIPLLLKFELPLPALAPYLYAGPTYSYLLKAEVDGEDVKDDMKSSEWSLAIGGGVQMLKFNVEIRYMMGLTELLDQDTTGDQGYLNDSKNRTVTFLVGYDLFSF